MDQIREFFYWTASVVLVLIGLLVVAIFALLAYLKRVADRSMQKLDYHVNNVSRTVRNYAFGRTIVRILRLFI